MRDYFDEVFNNNKNNEFKKILGDFDEARRIFLMNTDDILAGLLTTHSKRVASILANRKNQFIIFLPTPAIASGSFTLKAGKLGSGKLKRDLYLRIGGAASQSGRLFGFGTIPVNGSKPHSTNIDQWFRMDWHKWHGGSNKTHKRWLGSPDYAVGLPGYHFHMFGG